MMTALPTYLQHLKPTNTEAFERFLKTGLPSVKLEDWRYTNLNALEKQSFPALANFNDAAPSLAPGAVARLVFVNGVYTENLSHLPNISGLTIERVKTSNFAGPGWLELNAALATDTLRITAAQKIDGIVELVFIGSGHSRVDVQVNDNAALTILEYHTNSTAFSTLACNVQVGADAAFTRAFAGDLGDKAYSLFFDRITLAANASADQSFIHSHGKLTRRDCQVIHNGTLCSSVLRAVNNAAAHAHIDLLTDMQHMAPGTRSTQSIRAMAGDASRTVFQGKVLVAKPAQQTDASQVHHGLLLADNAEVDAKPGLEIYADDVKCAHGATCGALDETALFYMQSRGIPRAAAEKLLLKSFASTALADMPHAELADILAAFLTAQMGGSDED